MPSAEINAMLLKAITDDALRAELVVDPVAAGRKQKLSAKALKELEAINPASLSAQFERLQKVTKNLGGPLEAGYSRDFNDGNVHNKDDHVHDKQGHEVFDPSQQVINPAIDATTLNAALRDPVVLREFRGNPTLSKLAKDVLGRDI